MKIKLLLALAVIYASPAAAGPFNELIVFGDSTVDSGWWRGALQDQCGAVAAPCATGNNNKDTRIENAIANFGTGSPVGVGLMGSEVLAQLYGLPLLPANQPGGTNYAISGALNAATLANGFDGNLNQNINLPSTVQQMANYLAGQPGGTANSQALYLVSSGGNEITFALENPAFTTPAMRQAYVANQAKLLAEGIRNIQVTGAETILVHGLRGTGTLGTLYTQTLFNELSALGVQYIRSDIAALVASIEANPTLYGFTAATVKEGVPGTGTGSACVWTGNPEATGFGQWCGANTIPIPGHAYLRSADAQQTSLYSDELHFSAAGNALVAAYDFSLVNAALAVPGPMVGAGLPGLVLTFGGLLLWWRRRQQALSNAA